MTKYVDRDGVFRDEVVGDPTLVAEAPVAAQPVVAQPVAAQPVAAQPVVAQPVAAQQVVAQPGYTQAGYTQAAGQPVVGAVPAAAVVEPVHAMPSSSVVRRRFWQFDPGAIVTAIAGVILLLIGLIVISKAGLDGPITEPVVEVAGFTHTPLLGIIVAAAGLFMLLAGITRAREGAIFLSIVLGVAGIVAAVQEESFDESLAIEPSYAWMIVIVSGIVLLANLLVPVLSSRSTVYRNR